MRRRSRWRTQDTGHVQQVRPLRRRAARARSGLAPTRSPDARLVALLQALAQHVAARHADHARGRRAQQRAGRERRHRGCACEGGTPSARRAQRPAPCPCPSPLAPPVAAASMHSGHYVVLARAFWTPAGPPRNSGSPPVQDGALVRELKKDDAVRGEAMAANAASRPGGRSIGPRWQPGGLGKRARCSLRRRRFARKPRAAPPGRVARSGSCYTRRWVGTAATIAQRAAPSAT